MARSMKHLFILSLLLLPVPRAQAQRPVPRHQKKSAALIARQAPRMNSAASARTVPRTALASPSVVPATCPPDAAAAGGICGYLPVPFDREHPWRGTISIYFELYLHSGAGPAESAILFNEGGPGDGTTIWRGDAFYLFSQNLDTHDLLLIDDRGRGLSQTIDCSELQHGTVPFAQAEADCATQLGMSASFYGTGDVAEDTDAVRAALGYDKVDYYGISYGGADFVAYASRFGEHVRSAVLDSPYAGRVIDQFGFEEHARTHAMPQAVRLDCMRSPTCAADHPSPEEELDALIARVRLHPVEGDAYDANGNYVHVRIDEAFLLEYTIANPAWNFNNTGEVLAAGAALSRGEVKPLLRLGAEGYSIVAEGAGSYSPLATDWGDPTVYSIGARHSTFCADMRAPWDWEDTPSKRQKELTRAIGGFPQDYFHPFSMTAATTLEFSFPRQCLWWEKPAPSSPVVPAHAKYPDVPVLIFSGDMDTLVPTAATRDVAALFPSSTQIQVPEAGHASNFWSHCAANLASQFIENLLLGDTSCNHDPQTVWPAVGRFPKHAREARPAEVDTTGNNQTGVAERRVVTVAVATTTDAMQRSIFGSGDGFGLRKGTFHTDYMDVWTTTLTDCAFAEDVTVNGTVTWFPGDSFVTFGFGGDYSFTADLVVTGTGTSGGSLHVEGKLDAAGPVGKFKVSGVLGGRNVAVLVPEA
jgi:pimeloyl-ACP methyl ester carboxylesterase